MAVGAPLLPLLLRWYWVEAPRWEMVVDRFAVLSFYARLRF